MDELSQKINALLSSPDGMAKIQSAMASLSSSMPAPSSDETDSAPDLSGLLAMLGTNTPADTSPGDNTGFDLSRLASLLPLLSGMDQEDDNTALLKALRPHLHGEREKRLDSAIRMMKLWKFLPLLSGLGKE